MPQLQKVSMFLPKPLLDRAIAVSHSPTKTGAVILGLEELIRKKRIQNLIALKGSGKVRLTQKEIRELRA